MLLKADCNVIHTRYVHNLLHSEPSCAAVVLHWKSKKDQQIINEAKQLGIPVLVITAKLAAAVGAGKPFADVYLEAPAGNQEVIALLTDMTTVQQPKEAPLLALAAGA
jgi:ActR/RegA family two-component response regulator